MTTFNFREPGEFGDGATMTDSNTVPGEGHTKGLSELLACPFCGSNGDTFFKPTPNSPTGFRWSVVCNDKCLAEGPMENTEADAIAAWNLRSDAHTNGEVKALEWKGKNPIRDNGDLRAHSVVGMYEIGKVAGRVMVMLRCVKRGDADDIDIGSFDTFDEAKAAAQADFETRIRSALSLGHPIQAVAWTVRDGEPSGELGPTFDVMLPNGEWRGCIATDANDARQCIRAEWEAEQKHRADYAAPAIIEPPGWALVPLEPTEEMLDAADRARALPTFYTEEQWQAMLAARPRYAGDAS